MNLFEILITGIGFSTTRKSEISVRVFIVLTRAVVIKGFTYLENSNFFRFKRIFIRI
jgi:hypothetical protein